MNRGDAGTGHPGPQAPRHSSATTGSSRAARREPPRIWGCTSSGGPDRGKGSPMRWSAALRRG